MLVFVIFYSFFFFKQKTAYEMRISDWSSDVCSSDLFFVYSDRYHDFRHDVRRFLDIAMDKLNKTASESDISRMRDEFIRTMKFISANFPSAFYRPDGGRRVPRVRFEAIAVGAKLALSNQPTITHRS